MNLYEETIEILKENGRTFDDVVAVCGNEFQITKDNFVKYSNTEYYSGFGKPEVAEDLLVIGNDFWLERHEYDGSEWWEFKTIPKHKDLPFKEVTALTVRQSPGCFGWETLSSLNTTEKGGAEETNQKHFTPEDVRWMSREEVRKNYKAIMDSMKEWKGGAE